MASSSKIKAGEAFVRMSLDANAMVKGLRNVRRRLSSIGSAAANVGKKLTAMGVGVTASLGAAVAVFVKTGDALQKLAIRTGFSVESLSELEFAASQSGAALEDLEKGVRKMQQSIVDLGRGLSTQVDFFDKLGLSIRDLQGLSPDQQFELIADRVSQIADPTERAATAMAIFGRSGTKLLPLLNTGARGIAEFRKQARDLGLTLSNDDAQAAAQLGDALDQLRRGVTRIVVSIGAALAPTLQQLSGRLTETVASVIRWVDANRPLVVTLAKAGVVVVAAGTAFLGLSVALGTVGFAIAGIIGGITALGTAVGALVSVLGAVATPVGAVVAGVVALGAVVTAVAIKTGLAQKAIAAIGQVLSPLLTPIRRVAEVLREDLAGAFTGVKDAIAAGEFRLAVKILMATVQLEFARGTEALFNKWVEIKNKILSVPLLGGAVEAIKNQIDGAKLVFEALGSAVTAVIDKLRADWQAFVKTLQAGVSFLERVAPFIPGLGLARQLVTPAASPEGNASDDDRRKQKSLAKETAQRERNLELLRQEAAAKREAANAGAQTPASTPGVGVSEASFGAAQELSDFQRNLEQRLHDLRIAQIEDELQRDLAAIDAKYARETRAAREAGEDVTRLRLAQELEIQNRVAEANKRQAQEAADAAKQRAETLRDLADENQRLQIEASTPDASARELALLKLERGLALRDAGNDPDVRKQINRQFDLREQIAGQAGGDVTAGRAVGAFSGAQARAIGRGGSTRTERLLEEIQRNGREQREYLRRIADSQGAAA